MSNRKLRAQIYREVEEAWQRQAGDLVNLADIHPNDRQVDLVWPRALVAERGDATVSIERLTEMPNDWLREHGCDCSTGLAAARPVVVMLDDGVDVVAFHSDCDTELAQIDRAVAALQLARDALVQTGYRDFEPVENLS